MISTQPRASRTSLRSLLLGSLGAALATVALVGCDKGPRAETSAAKPTEPPAATFTAQPTAPAATTVPASGAAIDPAVAKPQGTAYGEGVKLTDATSISAILANPDPFVGKAVRVEGMIADVCPKRGCWMELAGDVEGDKLRFKVQDGVMVFPMDAKGKYAVAEGVVAVKDLTLEQSREYAEYQAKEYGRPYDPASITKPTRIVRIDGTGAVLRDQK